MAASASETWDRVLPLLTEGRVVPFLGAGVNLCSRQPPRYIHGQNLPDGRELARLLADRFKYPEPDAGDLLRVAQYVEVALGRDDLDQKLREVFRADYPTTRVHQFLATLPARLRAKGYAEGAHQVVVTTNYDDALERAFAEAKEPFDLVTYADGGRFWHTPAGQAPRLVERPNEYKDLPLEERSVIVKIHGTVSRDDPDQDSYVITEDDYIDYSARADLANLLPVELTARLKWSHFLFLGYSLRDWNLRILLHRIWKEQTKKKGTSQKHWAVQRGPSEIDKTYWAHRRVEVLDQELTECVDHLEQACQRLPDRAGQP